MLFKPSVTYVLFEMSCFTAVPLANQTLMYELLTSHEPFTEFILAGVAFDDSISFPENIQVRKSLAKNCHIILSDIRPCIHLRVT